MSYNIISVDPARTDATEHLGTRPKFWYLDPHGERWLFKAEERGTGEDWAEKIACELARVMGLPRVEYDLAIAIGSNTPVIRQTARAIGCDRTL